MVFDAYKKEKDILERASRLLHHPDGVDFAVEYAVLTKAYAKLITLTKRLVRISDRMERHLKEASLTIDEQRRRLATAHADLSRRNLQLEMKSTEFESIFNNSAMGIALLAPDGTVNRANKRLCEFLEEPPETVAGRRLRDYLLDGGNAPGGDAVLDCPEPGEIVQLERRVKTGAGRVFFAQLSGKALNPAKREDGIIWVLDDITSRKELETLQADVQRIMQHDLKGPLNGIINLPEIIGQGDNLTQEQHNLLEYISAAGNKMLRQIELSRDIYKMETGSYLFKPRPVDMVAVVRSVMHEYQDMAKTCNVALVSHYCGREMDQEDHLLGVAEELLSCIMLGNIVKNAIEASVPGEVVRIRLEQGPSIRLSVHNSQPVAAWFLPVFFNKYATTGKETGTGLGTYSAKLMATTQHVDVSVRSDPEDGTTVTFCIPPVSPQP